MIAFSDPFGTSGRWYKGNLHTHTTNSDGTLSPKETTEQYRVKGYDFVCLTDHGRVSDVKGLSTRGFLVISGEEVGVGRSALGEPYHLVAVGLEESVPEGGDDAQAIIDLMKSKGAVVLLCHPYWSSLSLEDMLRIQGYAGIEVFNTSCFLSIAKGHSAVHWDDLLIRGRRVWGFATDDAHNHFNDHRPNDACGSWVMVKSNSLSFEDIRDSMARGLFYASNGPSIDDLRVEGGSIIASVRGARTINFVADSYKGESFTAPAGKTIGGARYTIQGNERYVRLECIDAQGRTAWSNPIYFEADA